MWLTQFGVFGRLHRRRTGQVEERDVAAVTAFEEDVDEVDLFAVRPRAFRRLFARRVFQPQHLGVELDRLLRVAAAVGDMMQFLEHGPLLCSEAPA